MEDRSICFPGDEAVPDDTDGSAEYVPHRYDAVEAARLKAKTEEIKNQKINIAALEDALCEQDAAYEERLAAIEDALCELDKEE